MKIAFGCDHGGFPLKQAVFDAFADKSTVAEETLELDEKSFGDIMESEIKRIQESRAANQNEENK